MQSATQLTIVFGFFTSIFLFLVCLSIFTISSKVSKMQAILEKYLRAKYLHESKEWKKENIFEDIVTPKWAKEKGQEWNV